MSARDPALTTREIAGRRAREEARLLNLLVESRRLASFRSYLAATVVSMSALVPDVLALAEADVANAVERLRPSHAWPSIMADEAQYGRTGPATNRMVRIGRTYSKRPAPLIGDAVLSDGLLGPFVEAKIFGGSLDIVIRAEGFELTTMDGTGYLRLEAKLPDTVVAACSGRPLSDVVDHPVLRGRDLVISDAAQIGGVPSLTFDIGRLPVESPWLAAR